MTDAQMRDADAAMHQQMDEMYRRQVLEVTGSRDKPSLRERMANAYRSKWGDKASLAIREGRAKQSKQPNPTQAGVQARKNRNLVQTKLSDEEFDAFVADVQKKDTNRCRLLRTIVQNHYNIQNHG